MMKVKTKKGAINWHMFLRFLQEDEIEESKKIAEKWGEKIARTLSHYFYSRRKEESSNTTFLAEKFICNIVSDIVENISEHVVQYDVVGVAKVLFQESMLSRDFFKDKELTTLLFPNVECPKKIFKYYM